MGVRSLQRKRKSRPLSNVLLKFGKLVFVGILYCYTKATRRFCALHKDGPRHQIIPLLTLVMFGPVWYSLPLQGLQAADRTAPHTKGGS